MRAVETSVCSDACAATTWPYVRDFLSFPEFVDVVEEVRLVENHGDTRVTEWAVKLTGATLRWRETESIDDELRTISFVQDEGDLAHFAGVWTVLENYSDGGCTISLSAEFDIGIPMLSEVLDDVAARALVDTVQSILRRVESMASSGYHAAPVP